MSLSTQHYSTSKHGQLAFWIYLLHLLEACGKLILILTPLLCLGSDCEGDESLCLGPGAVQCILSRACPVSYPRSLATACSVWSARDPGTSGTGLWLPLIKMMNVTHQDGALSDKWPSQEAQDGWHRGDWGHPRHWCGGRRPRRNHYSSDHHPENCLGTDAPGLPAAGGEITLQFYVSQIRNLDWLSRIVYIVKRICLLLEILKVFACYKEIFYNQETVQFEPHLQTLF